MTLKKTQSKKLFEQASHVMVGGVNSPVRAFKAVGGNPLIIRKGKRSCFTDVDGNSYTDYCLSWGSLILGHGHPDVVKAVKGAINQGTSFGATTKAEIDIAQFIVNHVPSIELIRFVNSGTEATMSAIRVARGFTKRSKVIKFDGCYHGHCDDLLASAGSGVTFLAASSSQGIPASHIQDTLSLPYNDTETLVNTITRYPQEIACVILEPVVGNMGVVLPKPEFLRTLRAITKKHGIVLIFDEVMTGFRTNLGCAQSDLGITPDLTCLGKIIGAGFPVGAYGGRKDIMQSLSPLGGVYQAGTFSGNPVVMQAGLAALKNLTPSAYKQLNARAEKFAKEMNKFFLAKSIDAHFSHYKSMLSIRFRQKSVENYTDAKAASSDSIYGMLFHFLLRKGIYWPPADLEAFFISTQHQEKDLTTLANALKDFFTSAR